MASRTLTFADIIYGSIELPAWIEPFIRLPEFVRLRGVRLSNVDSFEFKDFSSPTRWEHCLAVAALAARCSRSRRASLSDEIHLCLAALLHDVGTPPFAHTGEYVVQSFDHETFTQSILAGTDDFEVSPATPIFESELPQFHRLCKSQSRHLRIKIDPLRVAELVVGRGELGFLIKGTLDLDNIDNVVRAATYMGMCVDRSLPLILTDWLAQQRHMPTLERLTTGPARKWLDLRDAIYERFFECSDAEMGRQAFLQHLMRRACSAGVPPRSILCQTDEGLLHQLAMWQEDLEPSGPTLTELVSRYRLLENPTKLTEIPLWTSVEVQIMRQPQAVAWLEKQLTAEGFEPAIMVAVNRSKGSSQETLLPSPPGILHVYKLGHGFRRAQLPSWLKNEIPGHLRGAALRERLGAVLRKRTDRWIITKPWLQMTEIRKTNVVQNLATVGNWSFRLSRNDSFHSYPSTFVHAIPSTLIHTLGIQGELVVDPFGGTGQTAAEAVRLGGEAISSDSNLIAWGAARARLSFIPDRERRRLRCLTQSDILDRVPSCPPEGSSVKRWFHAKTLEELSKIWALIRRRRDESACAFLTACFSAILPECTARRGKQHGYFADNCPLPNGMRQPPRQPACELFLRRVARALNGLERLYSLIQRNGRDPEDALSKVKVLRLDIRTAKPNDFGLEPRSVAAIITSPPYLCMADYALGQRLSYFWIDPDAMEEDFACEMGARRLRTKPHAVECSYFQDLERFASLAADLVRPGGFIATVLGQPVATAFKNTDVIRRYDRIMENQGFEKIWDRRRRINWHRNHGYSRLKTERISVHVVP